MPKISPISANKLIKVLEEAGFRVVRQKGSHIIMMNAKKNRIVIPIHPGKDIKPGLTRAILKEAGLSRETFQKILKKNRINSPPEGHIPTKAFNKEEKKEEKAV